MLKSAPVSWIEAANAQTSHRHTLNTAARQSNAFTHAACGRQKPNPMIRFVLRFLGLCLLATAFVFFVYDGTKSIANQQFVPLKVGELWADIDQHSLNAVQDWFKAKLLWAWDPYVQRFFDLPSWAVLAVIAAILVMLGRKKKRLIGYARD
jgi:hypothetical protein